MKKPTRFADATAVALILSSHFACAQKHQGKMDTDGVLSPGEIPNPRINYGNYNGAGSAYNGYGGYNGYGSSNNGYNQPYGGYQGYRPGPDYGRGECHDRRAQYGPPPHVEIYEVKPTGNVFGGQVKVRGFVEGICISEAGLFGMGRPITRINTALDRRFQRFEFEVKTRMADRPEIRVYSTSGARDISPIR